jgi:hypothetical protein
MNKKYCLLIAVCLLFILIPSAYAQVNVGLKEGDWVEYTATYTGNPPETYPETIRIEIQNIQDTTITLEIDRDLLNGTKDVRTHSFDLEDGAPDLIIIPANLNVGDEVNHAGVGSFTVEGTADYEFEGETRDLIYASVVGAEFKWDRTTGILIQADQSTDTFTQTWLAVDSNIEQTQASDLDPMLLYGIIIVVAIIIIIAVVLVLKRKK